jgi:hypothetical protein
VTAAGAHRAVVFPLAVRARVAYRAGLFHLAVRAGVAVRAAAFHLPVRARAAYRAGAFQLPVRAGVAGRAAAFRLAMGARSAHHAPVFALAVRAPLLSTHHSRSIDSSPTPACTLYLCSARHDATLATKRSVVAFLLAQSIDRPRRVSLVATELSPCASACRSSST